MKPHKHLPAALFELLLVSIPASAAPFSKKFPFAQADGTKIELWGKGAPPHGRHPRSKQEVFRRRALEKRAEWEDKSGTQERWNAMKVARRNADVQLAPDHRTSATGETLPSPPSYTTTSSKVGL